MKPLSDVAARLGYGPMDFWRSWSSCIRDRRENEGREWLTYDEYRVIFRLAHQAGLFAVYADGKGEPTARFHSPVGMALLRLYRAVKRAKEQGVPERQFHLEFCADVDRNSDVVRRFVEERESKARQAREKAESDRRGAGRRQRVEPKDDEPEFPGVVVGQESARHLQLVSTGKEQS